MKRTIIALDTDHIKEYVFGTSALKEIRGASVILDELNRKEMFEVVKKNDPSAECIYANGGSGMFNVDSDKADVCISEIRRLYRDKTITGSISGVRSPEHEDFSVDFDKTSKLLGARLRMAKDHGNPPLRLVTHSFFCICDSCGVEYAGHQGEENTLICPACMKKWKKNREIRDDIKAITSGKKTVSEKHKLWDRLLLDYNTRGRRRPEDFNKLGELSSPSGYIGLLYADGDSMGRRIESLKTVNAYEKFSKVVDDGIFHAALKAIQNHLEPKSDSPYFPFDILLLGGDDLVMATVADKAIEAAMTIIETFQYHTEREWGEPLTVSVGVVIAHAKFPFGTLLKMAEDLLKFAKKEGTRRSRDYSKRNGQGGLINFQVVSAGNSLRFTEDYNRIFVHKEKKQKLIRTLRPYDIQTMELLVKSIREMKSIPHNKIQALQDAVFLNYPDSVLQGLVIQNRLKKDQKRLLTDVLYSFSTSDNIFPFPWFEEGNAYHTPFLNIAELYDFIQ